MRGMQCGSMPSLGHLRCPMQCRSRSRFRRPRGSEMTSGVAVIGLGKIGLPLAVQMAGRGLRVRGADLSPRVADLVSGGQVPFPGEPGLAERLAEVVRAGLLTAGTDTAMAVAESAVVVVVVPLVTDQEGRPDYRSV